ncbi:MAG: S8 family serine peptidase [Pseudobdellovibrionaceae bacterium]|nr:MAG: S8 family serine peptidase [Pseudobdellovibrionaceae bacterium]
MAWAQDYVEGEVIVKLKADEGTTDSYAFLGKAYSSKNMALKNKWGRLNLYHFSFKSGKGGKSVHQIVEELKSDPTVEYAEPNYIIRKASVTGLSETFSKSEIQTMAAGGGYLATGAPIQAVEVWSTLSTPPPKPVVAIIDTGLDTSHEVFVDSHAIWSNPSEIPGNGIDDDGNGFTDDVNGWNFVTGDGNMYDDDGHGTHVAGIVLGTGLDIFQTPFDESKVQIMPLKFLDGQGVGKTSDAIKAIYYAVNNGAQVLNNSWGGPSYSKSLHEAVVYSYNAGTSFVVAAGNSGKDNDSTPMYPANLDVPNVISVAATDDSDYLASFSNYGFLSVHLASPGVFVLSTVPGNSYGTSSGTSMAAPFVAGVAALMKLESPQMRGYQIRDIIMSKGDHASSLNHKVATEARVNVKSAVDQARVAELYSNDPSYSMADRGLASAAASGGGCGLVTKVYRDFNKGGPGSGATPSPSLWYIGLVIGLLLLPLAIASILRRQQPSRRQYERFVVNTAVTVKSGERELVASISSLSMGGVKLDTDALLEQGGIVKMTISSPDGGDDLQVEGRVVWSEARKSYGVQFEEARTSVLDRIQNWTKNLTKAS